MYECTCSLGGRLNSRSASIIDLDAAWKKTTSLFWNPEKKLNSVRLLRMKRVDCSYQCWI